MNIEPLTACILRAMKWETMNLIGVALHKLRPQV